MKKWIISVTFACLAIASIAFSDYFPDVIVTSPNGVWTDTRAYATIDDAITAIGANVRDIYVVRQETTTALIVPANASLHFFAAGSIANSGQLTINTKNVFAGDRQIFTGAGDIDFIDGSVVRSTWFSDLVESLDMTNDDKLTLIVAEADNIDADAAVGNDVVLKWEAPGQIITADATFTLSNIKNIEAGDYQIIAGSGDFDFLDGTALNLSWAIRLRELLIWIEAETATIVVKGIHVVEYTQSTASNEFLHILPGGRLDPDPGVVLTLANPPLAGSYQIFGGSGAVTPPSGCVVKLAWYASLAKAVTDIGAVDVSLKVDASDTMTGNITIPNTVSLVGSKGNSVDTTGFTITVNGVCKASENMFTGTGAVTLNGTLIAGDVQLWASGVTVTGTAFTLVKPVWWGADDTGSVNCSTLITALHAAMVDGGTMDFGEGTKTYEFENVTFSKSVNMIGEATLRAADGNNDNELITFTGSNITIEGLAFDGDQANQTTVNTQEKQILYLGGGSTILNIDISHCAFTDSIASCIYARDVQNVKVTECSFRDIGKLSLVSRGIAIRLAEADDVFVSKNYIDAYGDSGKVGIRIGGPDDAVTPLYTPRNNRAVIVDNIVKNILYDDGAGGYGIGISIASYEEAIISNNQVYNSRGNCYDTNRTKNCTFTGNIAAGSIAKNGYNPDYTHDGDNEAGGILTVSSCIFRDNALRGLQISGAWDGSTTYAHYGATIVTGCIFQENGTAGVSARDTSSLTVSGNLFLDNHDGASSVQLYITSADDGTHYVGDVTVTGNTFKDTRGAVNATDYHIWFTKYTNAGYGADDDKMVCFNPVIGSNTFSGHLVSPLYSDASSNVPVGTPKFGYARVLNNHGTAQSITNGVGQKATSWDSCEFDTTGGAIGISLGLGNYIGQRKFFVMTTDGGSDVTLTVTHHETSTPEVFHFRDALDHLILEWQGDVWITIKNNGVELV